MLRASLTALWAFLFVIIMYVAFKPTPVPVGPWGDEAIHLCSGALLVMYPTIAFRNSRHTLFAVLAIIAGGAFLEFYQSFLPNRESSASDFMMNLCGICIGWLTGWLLRAGFYADPPDTNAPLA